jgi:hypothetical protein
MTVTHERNRSSSRSNPYYPNHHRQPMQHRVHVPRSNPLDKTGISHIASQSKPHFSDPNPLSIPHRPEYKTSRKAWRGRVGATSPIWRTDALRLRVAQAMVGIRVFPTSIGIQIMSLLPYATSHELPSLCDPASRVSGTGSCVYSALSGLIRKKGKEICG